MVSCAEHHLLWHNVYNNNHCRVAEEINLTSMIVLVAELTAGDTPEKVPPNPDLPSSKMPHNERIVGHALYFNTYSTWEGRVLYVEDVSVREEYCSMSAKHNKKQLCIQLV